jgi:D-tagatose-1,6-bisphosphate aldolase subunit GatZ/KbaZ
VLRESLRLSHLSGVPALIESTCNQVNQFGGYTGLTPADFAAFVHDLAGEVGVPSAEIILGGDHLGPSVWRSDDAETAMLMASDLVQEYVKAGFAKIHLDCSMPLQGDPPSGPSPDLVAQRAARLAQVAEQTTGQPLHYVIGTEVPPPGGAAGAHSALTVTAVADVRESIELHRRAFEGLGLQSAWDRVLAVVVQPGVEFGDDFVTPYRPERARDLRLFIETQPMVYEAHSTDYQAPQRLKQLVRDHFAILKVGPALTFAYREAVFSLAGMEDELFPAGERSNLIEALDEAMLRVPQHWEKFYHGSEAELAFKRRNSRSDRIRYYWARPEVQSAVRRLIRNLSGRRIPPSLIQQYAPQQALLEGQGSGFDPALMIAEHIAEVLRGYLAVCIPDSQAAA